MRRSPRSCCRTAARSTAEPAEIASALAALDLTTAPALGQLLQRLRDGLTLGAPPLRPRRRLRGARGFRPELDETCALRDDSRRVVAALESRLQGETGLALRIRHNAVLGYFIDTTAKQAETLLSPPWSTAFIHRQTTANQVRFTTPELAELDARIGQAASRALWPSRCETYRAAARRGGGAGLGQLHAAASALADLDVAAALAEWAVRGRRGAASGGRLHAAFEADAARHPVVEAAVRRAGDPYTPNDCRLDGEGAGRMPPPGHRHGAEHGG